MCVLLLYIFMCNKEAALIKTRSLFQNILMSPESKERYLISILELSVQWEDFFRVIKIH